MDSNDQHELCDSELVAVQRGATGNYLAERVSALDIPAEPTKAAVAADQVREHRFFRDVVEDNGGPRGEKLADMIADDLGISVDEVLRISADSEEGTDNSTLAVRQDLKDGEWAAFENRLRVVGRDESEGDFVVDCSTLAGASSLGDVLAPQIAAVGQVRRLREVRAITGFRRHGPDAVLIPADLSKQPGREPVYPAIELFGEGIFLKFDEDRLRKWEKDLAVQARADVLIQRRASEIWADRLDVPEPRYIALHTLAHLLIRRLAFASGYSSASLQERVYASTDRSDRMAGVLVYTAAGDAQGTLGGLVRLGDPASLSSLLLAAVADADVCSNDPVCIESDRQGASHLNLSACHGCALVSETSCETQNRLLDRQLLLGSHDVPGLLEDVLSRARAVRAH